MGGKNNALLNLVAGICIFISCSTAKQPKQMENNNYNPSVNAAGKAKTPDDFLASLLKTYPQYFDDILKKGQERNVQIIYTRVNRSANGVAELEHHYFNKNAGSYFYPASTVKLPVVLLALQRLNELKDKSINRNTTMITEKAFSGQTAVYNDPTAMDGRPSVAQYIKKILLVSDNDAYNRLYEFLGQEYINTEMKKKGYADVQILHRLNIFLTEEENRNSNPVLFYDAAGKLLYQQAGQRSNLKFVPRKDSLGKGYYSGGKLRNGPMDFSKKNRLGLEDLHKILLGIVFPDKVKESERFNITEEDRQFVLRYMSQYPTESKYPPYAADTANYWPAYSKFILLGGEKGKVPADIRIFSKSGDAYGHMIDAAYVVDFKNRVEFFISAIIYCNSDGILNDDRYDYDSVGKPFMKNLGKVIYEYELKRKYKVRPNLSPLLFAYDK